jgi:hypothetical protein
MRKAFLVTVFFLTACSIAAQAQAKSKPRAKMIDLNNESLTITTYYPSPVGSYNELTAKKFSLGSAALPTRSGDLVLQPQEGDPAKDWPAGVEGQLSYSQVSRSLFVYDGGKWVPFSFNEPEHKEVIRERSETHVPGVVHHVRTP